jgi:hypothetical protein
MQYGTFSAVNEGRKQVNIKMLECLVSTQRRVVAQFQNFRVEKFKELKRRGNEV